MIRLFNTDDERVTPDGSQANMRVEHVIADLIKWADNREYSLRDFEILVLGRVQIEVARAIIMRRKRRDRTGRRCIFDECPGKRGHDGACDRCGGGTLP